MPAKASKKVDVDGSSKESMSLAPAAEVRAYYIYLSYSNSVKKRRLRQFNSWSSNCNVFSLSGQGE